jgi:hypothetical protein
VRQFQNIWTEIAASCHYHVVGDAPEEGKHMKAIFFINIKVFFVATLLATAALGESPAKEKSPPSTTGFTSAKLELSFGLPDEYPQQPMEITVTDAEIVAKLAACFEGMGQGKKGAEPGDWRGRYVIRFISAKGAPIKINVNYEYTTWSEGNGDWQVKGDLKKLIQDLAARERRRGSGCSSSTSPSP